MSTPHLDKKYIAKLPGKDEYITKSEALNTDELKKQIVASESTIQSCEKDMENDSKLAAAKEDVKLLAADYKDILAEEKAKIKAMVFILQTRGAI